MNGMPAPVLNRRLSALDAAFLYFEKQNAPMHIGSVSILDGMVAYDDLVDDVERRLHLIPRFLQKVVPAPLNVGHPTWEFDPDFGIHNHIMMHQVRRPGGMAELDEVLRRVFSGPLDRNKPLWEMHLILGLEQGRCAVATKVHHAMVDGVGGGELIARLLDITPNRQLPPKQPYSPPPIPEPRRRLVDALWDNAIMGIEAWSNYSKELVEATRGFNAEQARLAVRALTELVPDFSMPPRRMPFNQTGSGELRVLWTELSFAEARAIRTALGVSVNDVMLSVLAGAVGRYARLHGQNTDGVRIRVMVPVNVRRVEDKAQLGNKVSMLPVRLPIDIEDPKDRVRVVRQSMETLKEAKVSRVFAALSELWGGTVPPAALAAVGSVAFAPVPIFNTVCTNVPGPQIPLYQVGRRVVTYVPMVPVGYDLGINCAIFTYNQKMVTSLIVDVGACPDADEIRGLIESEFAELRRAAGVPEIPMVDISPRPRPERGQRSAAGSGETTPESAAAATAGLDTPGTSQAEKAITGEKSKSGKGGAEAESQAEVEERRAGGKAPGSERIDPKTKAPGAGAGGAAKKASGHETKAGNQRPAEAARNQPEGEAEHVNGSHRQGGAAGEDAPGAEATGARRGGSKD